MIVLDASVLIAYLDTQDSHHDRAEALLVEQIDDDFAANTLTLAEVLVMPARQGRLAAARAALDALEVRELVFGAGSAVELAQIRASTGLEMPDCCVLLAAEDTRARVASFDERLAETAASRDLVMVEG